VDRGPGATNYDMGRGPAGQEAGQGDSPDDPTKLKYQRLYAPEHHWSTGPRLRARNQRPGAAGVVIGEVRGPAALQDSYAPLYEVLPSYRRQAEDAIESNRIPATQRKRVRDYFTGLQETIGEHPPRQ